METKPKLGHNGNGKVEIHDGCTGCETIGTCGGKKTNELPLPNLQRLAPGMKKFDCHTMTAEFAPRPPDPKATRRQYGEAALHY